MSKAGEAIGRFGRGLAATPDHFLDRISRLNSTNFRIFATYSFIGATALRYLGARYLFGDDWRPSLEWLGFLSTLAGWDGAQFFAKRKTHGRFADDPKPEPPRAD